MKNIKIIVAIIFVIVLLLSVIIICINLREINIGKYNKFLNVYNMNTDLDNIEIYIRNVLGENKVLIDKDEDKCDILAEISNTNIQRKIVNEDIIGIACCRITIKNIKNNSIININISNDEITIENKKYKIKTNNDIFEKIKNIIVKYNEDIYMC